MPISILEILNWSPYGFYEYIEEMKKICHRFINAKGVETYKKCINPSICYFKVVQCINWIGSEFNIINYRIKDYSQYSVFRHFLSAEEAWLNEEEISDALKEGFCELNLLLINEAEKGNGIKVYDLMKKGANPPN